MNRLPIIAALASLVISATAVAAPESPSAPLPEPIAQGPYQASWDSLKQYQCPPWYRDAKFGIWAHWSAQCVPEVGDWYARDLYKPDVDPKSWEYGAAQHAYDFHLKTYGHPSQFGFKDIINLWKAEHWDPDQLMALYKRAGAQYFVALANHHCNFDEWNSKYHAWNSVNMGPRKDLTAGWAKAAQAQGLHFGVSVHAARSWEWYEPAQGSDKTGPLAGVPYDGKLTKADGKGTWWEGYDPQELYCQNHKPGEPRSQAYADQFYLRTKDLIDNYHPDLIYYDDWQLPMNQTIGLALAAHFYNARMAADGQTQAVMNTKGLTPDQRKVLVWDIERGKSDRIEPYPWQADTCLGGWHYNIDIYKSNSYKSASTVLATLADVVSKNGNLLLSVPLRADGTPDEKELKVLDDLAAWMSVDRECIFDTRPWVRFGEGPSTKEKAGDFNESSGHSTPRDIRFTTRGQTLYAIVLAWPSNQHLLVRSLSRVPNAGVISEVSLLGYAGQLTWSHNPDGLLVDLPATPPCKGPFALKITGPGLATYPVIDLPAAELPTSDAKGHLTLDTSSVTIHGQGAFVEERHPDGNIGGWTNPETSISWDCLIREPGTYRITINHAGVATHALITCGARQIPATLPATAGYTTFVTTPAGSLTISQPGKLQITMKPKDKSSWSPINLASITLTRQ